MVVAPEKIPWQALRTLLGQSIYGGRLDNEFDQAVLQTFLSHLFTAQSFDPDFPLVPGGEVNLTLPEEANSRENILAWVCGQWTLSLWFGVAMMRNSFSVFPTVRLTIENQLTPTHELIFLCSILLFSILY